MSYVIEQERTPEKLADLLALLQAQGMRPTWGDLAGLYMSLPGLRGFWPGSAVGDAGELVDRSGNGLHLTNAGDCVFGVDGMIPYVKYDIDDDDYHAYSDGAYFDITGTEFYIDNPGLTVGAWVQFDNAASGNEYVLAKMESGSNDLAYGLRRDATGAVVVEVYQSAVGASPSSSITSDDLIGAGAWTLVIGRWVPSTEVVVMVNGVKKLHTSSIISSIANGSAAFNIGGRSGTSLITGRISHAFLCASAVPDAHLNAIYNLGKWLFGA